MLRWILVVIAVLLVIRIIVRIFKALFPPIDSGKNSNQSQAKHFPNEVDYTDVQDAKFKDIQ